MRSRHSSGASVGGGEVVVDLTMLFLVVKCVLNRVNSFWSVLRSLLMDACTPLSPMASAFTWASSRAIGIRHGLSDRLESGQRRP